MFSLLQFFLRSRPVKIWLYYTEQKTILIIRTIILEHGKVRLLLHVDGYR